MNKSSAFNSNEYDDKIKQTVPFYDEFYNQTIDIIKTIFDKRLSWLDVGCGTGKMAQRAILTLPIENITLCDLSSDMLHMAKNKLSFPKAEFINCKVQDLCFKKKFDVVTSIMVNHYLKNEQRIKGLKKCYDALKDGGVYISFENIAPYSEEGKKLSLNRWKEYQISNGRSEEESINHVHRYNKNYFPMTVDKNIAQLKKCGFKAVEIIWLSYMQAGFMGIK